MNIPRVTYHRLIVIAPLVVLLVAGLGWKLTKGVGQHSLLPVAGVMLALVLAASLMIIERARSGKKYASGAKKRRQALLPFVYGKRERAVEQN